MVCCGDKLFRRDLIQQLGEGGQTLPSLTPIHVGDKLQNKWDNDKVDP
jgi:hypothetical protein